jgi:predicted transcriptional regulator
MFVTKTKTQREFYTEIANYLEAVGAPEEYVEFIDGRIAQLDKRKNGAKTATKTQRENVAYKQEIVRVLNGTKAATATEVATELDLKVQKVTALLTQLVKAGVVTRTQDGKKVLFNTPE